MAPRFMTLPDGEKNGADKIVHNLVIYASYWLFVEYLHYQLLHIRISIILVKLMVIPCKQDPVKLIGECIIRGGFVHSLGRP